MFNTRTLVLALIIFLMVAIRVIAPFLPNFEYVANFTMLGAVSLFGGAYFKDNAKAFGFPLVALFLSDLILGLVKYKTTGFLYEGWYFTYLAFALMVLTGKLLMQKVNVVSFLGGTAVIVFIHWIVSDFGVWYGSSFYPQTLAGYWECLVSAIPFERNFLYGTLIYGAIMFGGFETLKAKYLSLRLTEPVKS